MGKSRTHTICMAGQFECADWWDEMRITKESEQGGARQYECAVGEKVTHTRSSPAEVSGPLETCTTDNNAHSLFESATPGQSIVLIDDGVYLRPTPRHSLCYLDFSQ